MARITQIGQAKTPFYQSTKYSTWVLATGNTSFTPFNNVEAANLRNYTKGQNIFKNNQGQVLAFKAVISGASFAKLPLQTLATGAFDIYDSLQSFIRQGQYAITQDSRVVHEGLMLDLVQPLPLVATPIIAGVPANAYGPVSITSDNDSSGMVKRAQKAGVYFSPPLFVANGRAIDFQVSFPTGYSVPAALNTFCVQFILITEELPQSNISQVR